MIWPAFRLEPSGIVEVDFTSTSTAHGWKSYCPGQTSGGAIPATVTRNPSSGTAPGFSNGDAAAQRLDGSSIAVLPRRRNLEPARAPTLRFPPGKGNRR